MSRPIIDLDAVASWPTGLLDMLRSDIPSLNKEREAQRVYDVSPSTDRFFGRRPLRPVWDAATAYIERHAAAWDLRVFHATRLLDGHDIWQNGLRRLDLAERLGSVKAALTAAGLTKGHIEALALPRDDPAFTDGREGVVWFTPLRAALHDGGCDVFFEHYGGEAIQRIAESASNSALKAVQALGAPAVVVTTIPASGWCLFADGRLAQTLIELFLQAEGGREASDYGWDVMVERDVPADRIEAIVAPTDAMVRG